MNKRLLHGFMRPFTFFLFRLVSVHWAIGVGYGGVDPAMDADFRQFQLYSTAQVLQSLEIPEDGTGRSVRTFLMATDFKYPYVQVEEILQRDPATGQSVVLSRQEYVANHIIVRIKPSASLGALRDLSERRGMRILKGLRAPGFYLVALDSHEIGAVSTAIADYSREKDIVAYAEPDFIVHADARFPNDPSFNLLYGLHNTGADGGTADADIDAPEAWAMVTGDASVLVGVIDTGIDYTHPDLAANMWANPGETGLDVYGRDKRSNGLDDDENGFVDDHRGWDFVNEDNNPMDDHSHGTHCAGTIGGVGNNGVGVVGVAWRVGLVGIKFLSAGGSGSTSDAIESVYYATTLRLRLTSNSWGGGGYSQGLADAIEDANDHGLLFVAAAGNSGSDNDSSPQYPSSYNNDNIIAVAATDRNDNRAYFSCYGANSVDLGAPGLDIYSTTPNNGYGSKSGTSMATPHVAGAAALLWSSVVGVGHTEIKSALLMGVDPIPALDGKVVSGGRLNVYNSLLRLGLQVVESTPGRDEVIQTPMTNVLIRFNAPYAPGSVQASDLLVNNTPAHAFDLTDATSIRFRYTSSPVSNDGVQNASMAEGVIWRLSDSNGVAAWSSPFRYDSLSMRVVDTVPSSGSLVQLPFTNLSVLLNEGVAAGSVGLDDLVLSRGRVSSVRISETNRIEYGLEGIAGEEALLISLSAGALADTHGNPCESFNGEYETDISVVPLPVPLNAYFPRGSLVYGTTVSGTVGSGDDVDGYTLTVNAGQTITVVAKPDSSLQPVIALVGPGGITNRVSAAMGPGHSALLQAEPTEAGVCQMVIQSAGASTGHYEVQVILNAMMEEEGITGVGNNSRAEAQNMEDSFIALASDATRGFVVGDVSDGEDWYQFGMDKDMPATMAIKSMSGDASLQLYDGAGVLVAEGTRDRMNVTEYIENFVASNSTVYSLRIAGSGVYHLVVVRNASFDLELNSLATPQTPCGTGLVLGSVSKDAGSGKVLAYSFDADSGGIVYDGSEGQNTGVVVGAVFTTNGYSLGAYDFRGTSDYIYAENSGSLNITGALTIASWVRPETFTEWVAWVSKGTRGDTRSQWRTGFGTRSTQWGLTWWNGAAWSDYWAQDTIPFGVWSHVCMVADPGEKTICLYRDGVQVAAWNNVAVNFPASTNRVYIGHQKDNNNYFDGQIDEVQIFSRALASNEVSSLYKGEAGDFYVIHLAEGDHLAVRTSTPFDGNPEFRNSMDPALELCDPQGTRILFDDNGGVDGRNAALTYVADSAGLYALGVLAEGGSGEYLLSIHSRLLAMDLQGNAVEGDGTLLGSVSVEAALDSDLLIALESDNHSEATVPASVTLSAGQTSVVFSITVVDDSLLDGTQEAWISAWANSVGSIRKRLLVHDNESAVLRVRLPESAVEGDGLLAGQGVVEVSSPVERRVQVILTSEDTSEILVPPFMVIESGQTSGVFDITIPDDGLIDGVQAVHVQASVSNWVSSTGQIQIHDNEACGLVMEIPPNAVEDAGLLTGRVHIAGTLASNLFVLLASDHPSKVSVPAEALLVAGQTSVVFALTVHDDHEATGATLTHITASAQGFFTATNSLVILDDDVHHFEWGLISSPQRAGNPFDATLTARAVDGSIQHFFTGAASLSGTGLEGPISLFPTSTSAFVAGIWSGSLVLNTDGTAIVLTATDGHGHTGQSNPFDAVVPRIHISPLAHTNVPVIVGTSSNRWVAIANQGGYVLNCALPYTSLSDKDLMLWYSFDRDENGYVSDLSGRENTGVVSGATYITNGYSAGAYFFDGSNDMIWAHGAGDLNITGQLTVCAWVNPSESGSWSAWVSKGNTNNSRSQWRVGYGTASSQWGLTRWWISGWGDWWANNTIDTGVWTHVAMVANPAHGDLRLYKNGERVYAWTNLSALYFQPSTNRFYIGHQRDNISFFHGAIDEVMVFRRALTGVDISALYAGVSPVPWLSIEPETLTLPAGASSNVILTFNARMFSRGSCTSLTLKVVCDDPSSPTNWIPVSMVVVPEAPMLFSPAYFLGTSSAITCAPMAGVSLYLAEGSSYAEFAGATNSGWADGTNFQFHGLSEDTLYYYRAKAAVTNGFGRYDGPWSAPITAVQLSPQGDWDGDGMDNQSEMLTGTSPTDDRSVFAITGLQSDGLGFEFEWHGGSGLVQYIEYTADLQSGSWGCLHTNATPEQFTNVWRRVLDGSNGAYRLKVDPARSFHVASFCTPK